eukprot:GFKZ01001502.1.p2 GENE.GFKZ01001502.1~~GFKZ01001502.1.p2  ORF type:complete len:281 (-),score=57.91 GFKZ01001502.1:1645-2487(-)
MFEARMAQSSTLKRVLDAIKELITQTNFDCSADGISLQAMDESHVCLATMKLRNQAFEMYRCDKPHSIGINLNSLSKILKCAANDDSVKIVADDEGADSAEFIFENASADRVAHFELKLMDIDLEHMNVPDDSDYQAVINLPASEYRRIFTDLAVIGDVICIEVSKNSACFSVAGDIGSCSLNIQQTDAADSNNSNPVTINVKEPLKMTFPGKYLMMFTKAVPLSDSVTMCIQDGHPLAIEFSIPEEGGYVRYFLAPKIDQDDEDEDVKEEPDVDGDEEE